MESPAQGNQPSGRVQGKGRAVSEAAKTYDSSTAQVPVLTCKEGGEQVEEGMRSRGGTVPADETLARFPDLTFSSRGGAVSADETVGNPIE